MFVWNSVLLLGLDFLGLLGVNLRREHRDCTLVATSLVEVHNTVGQCIECVVFALGYVLTGEMLVTTLTHDDVAGDDLLTTPNLNTKPL